MSSRSTIDAEFMEICLKELDHCKGEEDAVVCAYNAVSDDPSLPEQQKTVKKNIIRFLLATNQLNRLYFIVRSGIMTLINGVILIIAIFFLGSINVLQAIILGILFYFVSLILSRILDTKINRGTTMIIKTLEHHEKLKNRLLKII